MNGVEILCVKAKRIAIMGLLVETFDTASDKRAVIRGMVEITAISEQAGQILLETYVPEAA